MFILLLGSIKREILLVWRQTGKTALLTFSFIKSLKFCWQSPINIPWYFYFYIYIYFCHELWAIKPMSCFSVCDKNFNCLVLFLSVLVTLLFSSSPVDFPLNDCWRQWDQKSVLGDFSCDNYGNILVKTAHWVLQIACSVLFACCDE